MHKCKPFFVSQLIYNYFLKGVWLNKGRNGGGSGGLNSIIPSLELKSDVMTEMRNSSIPVKGKKKSNIPCSWWFGGLPICSVLCMFFDPFVFPTFLGKLPFIKSRRDKNTWRKGQHRKFPRLLCFSYSLPSHDSRLSSDMSISWKEEYTGKIILAFHSGIVIEISSLRLGSLCFPVK